MKYEAGIDLRNANSSHALLVELIGRDKRVLDIGCATGELGSILQRRGCRVSGVELDAAEGRAAAQVLEEVLVGDVGELDLVGHFGEESFDVVVFGDVLEHIADPTAVLREVLPLLAPSGSVVASIPNVAHGSVRLALLQGRFDYRPLGLLDATHVRFFTRGSVHALLREAGLVPVDMRRTTAGVFDTGIGVRREDFEEGVVDAVEGDPDSTTYQFVLRAVPVGSPEADGGHAVEPAVEVAGGTCRIGIWGRFEPDDIRSALVMRVTAAELTRRMQAPTVRVFSSSADARPSPHDGGLPIEALGPWSAERADRLASELDCIVIVGDLPGDAELESGRDPARYLLEGPGRDGEEDCPVVWSAVRLPEHSQTGSGRAGAVPGYRAVLDVGPANLAPDSTDEMTVAVPDPLLLAVRLLRSEALSRRLDFVRMMGWFPASGPAVVVETSGHLLPHAGAIAAALDAVVAGSGAGVVLVQVRSHDVDGQRAAGAIEAAMTTPVFLVPGDVLADDVVAVIANATTLAACTSSAATLGQSYERPIAYVDLAGDPSLGRLADTTGNLDAVMTTPEELARLLEIERLQPVGGAVAKMQSKLDAHFDRLAVIAGAAAAARPRPADSHTVLRAAEYVAAVELAHRRMQDRLDAERRAVADHLAGLRASQDALRAERDSLEIRLIEATSRAGREAALQDERDAAVAALEALQGIRVLRMLRPLRAAYARLRGGRL